VTPLLVCLSLGQKRPYYKIYLTNPLKCDTIALVNKNNHADIQEDKIMDIINTLILAADSPATGDDFPVVPLVIAIGAAVVIAVVSTVIAAVKKKKDDDDK